MAIITDLTKLVEERNAQKMAPAGPVYPTLDALLEALEPDSYFLQKLEEEEDWPYTDEDYSSNTPCDNSGFCAGSSCPNFFKCQGKT